MRKSRNFALGIGLLLAALAPATVGNAQTKKPIKIGLLTSFSGPFTPWGILVREGMNLAVSEVNAAGGVLGRPIEIVARDDRNNPSEAITAFKYMVEREGVSAVGGIISSDVGLATSREAEASHVPLFLTMSGSDAILHKSSRYTFRTCLPAAPMNMSYIADLIKEKKYTRVGAIVADYAWGHAMQKAINEIIKPLPGVKVQIEVAPVTERDFTPYLRKLQSLKPQLLIAIGHPPGTATITRQSIEMGMKGLVIGPWFPTELLVKRVGTLMFGHYVDYTCAAFHSRAYDKLAAKFYAVNKHLLDAAGMSGYAMVKMVAQTIAKKKSTDPKVVAKALHAGTFKIPGYAWPLSWTAWGEMNKAAPILYTYEKGSPPDHINPGADWRTKIVFRSKPVPPYVPSK